MPARRKGPRLLMVVEAWFPTHGGGGAEVQVRSLSRHFAARGFEVTICAPLLPRPNAPDTREVDGVPIHRIEYPGWPLLGGLIMLAKLAAYLWRERGRIDVIHSHIAGNMSAVCCVMGRVIGKPVVVKLTGLTEMAGGILDPDPPLSARLRRLAIRQAHRIQAISQRIAADLVSVGFRPEQVLHIPNSVDLTRFDQQVLPADTPAVAGVAACRHVGVFVGRLHADKNIELLLRGWARVFRGRDDAALLMLGAGGLRPALEALAAGLGIGAQVRFLGPISDVERYLKLADFGVLTSKAEGLSNTLLEYLSSGLPVVGSEVSGNEDFIVPGQTGWLFPATDEDAFVRCLQAAAATSPAQFAVMGQAARARVAAHAALPAVLDALTLAYGVGSVGPTSPSANSPAGTAPAGRPVDASH